MKRGDRFSLFSSVDRLVTTVVGSATRAFIALVLRGVVVTTHCGITPGTGEIRKPRIRLSQVSSYCHEALSSSQANECCGPLSWSGSSALYVVAYEPLGHTNKRRDGLYSGLNQGGDMARMPLRPFIMTSRTSATVRPTNAM